MAGHQDTMNVLANDFTARWQDAEPDLRRDLENATAEDRQAVTKRDYTIANVTPGQAVGPIGSVASTAEIVNSIVAQATSTLAQERAMA